MKTARREGGSREAFRRVRVPWAGRLRAAAALLLMAGAAEGAGEKAFTPGRVWHDTTGVAINAHGGGILFHGGVYYWYGEQKLGPTWLPKANQGWEGTRTTPGGVSCYSSTNLHDWKNEGVVLPSNPRDPDHDLSCENVIERPKVVYNAGTGRFVMWFHQDTPDYKAARTAVAVAGAPAGPFTYLGSFRPNAGVWPVNVTAADQQAAPRNFLQRDFEGGQMSRDMTLFVDDDGTAYQFYASEENGTMHVSQLTEDYLKPSGKYARIFIGRSMEAPAVFKHAGHYYLIGSGCSGWKPNAARSAVAENIFGPWRELGNPCRGENAGRTFDSQSTFVLPVHGRPGNFIALFDRWNPWDLQNSLYVWLPLRFDGDGRPAVEWRDRWPVPAVLP